MQLEDISIHAFIQKHNIKNETGVPIDFKNHMFLFDVYRDFSPIMVVTKAAQVGMTTAECIKTLWGVRNKAFDAIYCLPTDTDVNVMVGSKVNRIISQNPIFQQWTKDKDTIAQKQIGDNYIHFRGTWTQKAAIMVSSDWNLYDEVDACKQEVLEQYATRLQHSKYRYEHYFSHPSAEGYGVDKMWRKSDQKHWFVKCLHCTKKQYLEWPQSIDMEKKLFQCKHCHGQITDEDRRRGEWIKKYNDRDISGYWIPLLICPWVSAAEIIKYSVEKSEEYFYNKVLGLPYVGKGNKLTKSHLLKNVTNRTLVPDKNERVVIGIDTGLKIDFVIGSKHGLFYQGDCEDYTTLDNLMKEYPKAVAIIDGGGDLIGSRAFQNRWKGRVWLCFLTGDKKGTDEPQWKDEERTVIVDRNKYIQITVDEFIASKIPLQGTEDDWYEYWMDWDALTRTKVVDSTTGEFKGYKWIRSGRDHRALATVFWRVGMTKFGRGDGKIFSGESTDFKTAPSLLPDDRVIWKPKFIMPELEDNN